MTSYILGDGSDGALVVASGTTNLLLDNAYNYSSISIAAGATLSTAATTGTALLLKCAGSTLIDGTIALNSKITAFSTGGFKSRLLNYEFDYAD